MPIRHQLSDVDTLDSLSYRYLGDENRRSEIISYNNLISPYISTDREDKYITYARGYLLAIRENTASALTVRKHWTVKSKPSIMSTAVKTYYVLEDVIFEEGQKEAYIPIRSYVSGIQGNTPDNTVVELGQEFFEADVALDITNPLPINGGLEGHVLCTGDYIYIPTEDEITDLDVTERIFTLDKAYYFYGSDIKLSSEDGFTFENGDLATVSYVKNVEQAVRERLRAEIGDNPHDYEWGTDLYQLIGDGTIPLDVLEKRIEIEIYQRLAYEDRVTNPNITNIVIDKANCSARIDIDMYVTQLSELLSVENIQIGGLTDV